MKKTILLAAFAWLSVGLAASQAPTPAPATRPAPAKATPVRATPQAAAPAATAGAPAEYKELMTKYCVTCHNERLKTPASDPLFLDKADLDHPGKDAAAWEKVVRKLGAVGTMPPANSPQPGAAKLAEFRTWLIELARPRGGYATDRRPVRAAPLEPD